MRGQLRIESMFAFVMVDDDGTEGIPAFRDPLGTAMPLVGADMAMVEKLRPVAQAFATSHGKAVTLVHFTQRAEIEVLEP